LSANNGPGGLSLPDQKNYELAYGLALKLAGEKLSNRGDITEQCRRSEATYEITGQSVVIHTKYLNREYRVTLPDITVTFTDSQDEVELRDKVLILHYLERAKGTPLTEKLIAYQELDEGAVYYPSFFKRAVKPLIDYFGPTPDSLLTTAIKLGGIKTNYGDASVIIRAFSRVPINIVIWKGDEEFPPNASILFDETVLDYLSAEDINVLCQTITWRLVKSR
jgi:hypothetical protein